jgi:hypothetical protein
MATFPNQQREPMRTRGFEIISSYLNAGIKLPQRETAHSAGYYIEAAKTSPCRPGLSRLSPPASRLTCSPTSSWQFTSEAASHSRTAFPSSTTWALSMRTTTTTLQTKGTSWSVSPIPWTAPSTSRKVRKWARAYS